MVAVLKTFGLAPRGVVVVLRLGRDDLADLEDSDKPYRILYASDDLFGTTRALMGLQPGDEAPSLGFGEVDELRKCKNVKCAVVCSTTVPAYNFHSDGAVGGARKFLFAGLDEAGLVRARWPDVVFMLTRPLAWAPFFPTLAAQSSDI